MESEASRKKVQEFFHAYEDMEASCCKKFGVHSQGVLLYINRLNGIRNAEKKEEILPKIVGVLDLYQRNMTEVKNGGTDSNALFPCPEVENEDIRFCRKFQKMIAKRRDPISVYLQQNKRTCRWRVVGRWVGTVLLLAVLGIVTYFLLKYL